MTISIFKGFNFFVFYDLLLNSTDGMRLKAILVVYSISFMELRG
jgi:hypothetical protein